mgnify:CR=1 FL=1
MKENGTRIFPNYEFKISLYLFGKIKWFSIKIDNKKLKNKYKKMILDTISVKQFGQDFKKQDLKYIKTLKPKISHLKIKKKYYN